MGLFLAMDAGGTKTQCLIADETRVLARAATGR
jgi:glucosamine kinase